MHCLADQGGTMPAEAQPRFESAIGERKLLTASIDGATVAYVDRDPSVPPQNPTRGVAPTVFMLF